VPIPETLNHYRILGPLGKGGMGEVYAAEDTRLNRKVAIKVLPPLLADDPERRLRFEREAQLIAALNHPNIVTIHSVEEDGGVPFLTMELVDGRPLSDITKGGAGLPLDTLLRVGLAVSDAMAAAHQRGITHRDLKPGNIMLTPDGRVKVLDFGLAKLREVELAASADEVTRAPSGDLTGEGRIIGTVAYMSPEQAEGKEVDQRSDIFSLGVVLHELATGQKPFKGETTVSLISSILKDTPTPVTEINPGLPSGLARVIRRSLAKDPSRRYQTATDLRNDLEDLKQEIDSGVTEMASSRAPVRPARRRLPSWIVQAALVVLALAIGLAAYAFWQNRSVAAPGDGLVVERPARLTSAGNAAFAAISPDGRYVAHVKNDPGRPSLWMRQATTTSDVEIVPAAPVRYDGVTFSPDGDHVYYVTYEQTGGIGTLYRIPALGGTPQTVIVDVDSRVVFSPDRARMAFMRGMPAEGTAYVMTAAADGTDVKPLARLENPDSFTLEGPAWSRDGRMLLVPGQSVHEGPHRAIFAVDVETGQTTRLEGRWNNVGDLEWVPGTDTFLAAAVEPGSTNPQLWQISYPSGQRRRITNDLNSYASVSLSADGASMATVQTEAVSNLWVSNTADPGSAVQITRGRGRGDGLGGMDWTPDGRIVYLSTASGHPQIWISDPEGRTVKQLTAAQQEPVFSASVTPDGRHILFQRLADRRMRIWRMNIDGSDQRPVTDGPLDLSAVAGPDGAVYFNRVTEGSPRTFKVPIDGGAAVAVSDSIFRPLDVSPDGSLLLGVSWDEEARRSVLAIMPAAGDDLRLLRDIPAFVGSFSADARAVIFARVAQGAVQLMQFDLESGVTETHGSLPDMVFNGALSPDGSRLALARGGIVSDVLLLSMIRN
jgi:Tol biopolymer transport system component/predicted Ser/Thr protein kinase